MQIALSSDDVIFITVVERVVSSIGLIRGFKFYTASIDGNNFVFLMFQMPVAKNCKLKQFSA